MSIRRMMLFTLGGFFKSIIALFKARVLSDAGNFEAETNLENQLNTLGSTLFDSASLVFTPNGVKTSKLYTIKPNDGTGDLTVTRNTSATRVNERGLIETVPYNILSYSEDFSNSYWVKTNYTIVPNSGISPIGTMTATSIIPPTSVSVDLRNTTVNGIGGETYIWSCYIKSNGLRYVSLTAWNSDDPVTNFDLQNGVVVSQSGPQSTAKITNVGNGWYLCEVSRVLRKDYLGIWLRIGQTALNGSNVNGSNGYLIWGAQVVRSNEPKPYQLTTDRLNVPRIDYTNGSPAILVEPQRTNLILQSEDFTNGWAQEGISVLSNTQISPDGALTADNIFELGTNDIHRTYRNSSISVTANAIYTASFFVKKNNVRYVRLILTQQGSTTIWAGAQFDLDTQTFTSQVGIDGGVFSSASITSLSNGWYRISVSGSITGASMMPMLALSNGSALLNTDTRGCPIYLGNVNNSLYVWGGQLELGSSVTSYIPTTTSSVTRNADVISKSGIYTNGLITSAGGTMFIELKNNTPVIGSNFSDFNLGIGSTFNGYGGNGSLSLWNFSGLISRLQIIKNVGGTYSTLYTSTTDNCKIVIKWNGTTVDVFENGVKVVNASSFNITNMNFLYGNGQRRSFLLNKMFLFTTPLTDTQAIQLTTL